MQRRPRSKPVKKAFGAVLRDLREQAGISQEMLAHRARLTRNFIGMLERAERTPTIDTLFELAKVLGVAPHAFVQLVEERIG